MKKELCIDIDGCIADFAGAAVRVVNAAYGTNFSNGDITDYDWTKCLGLTKDQELMLFRFLEEAVIYDRLEAIPGAVDGVNNLAESYNIRLLTKRPRWSLDVTARHMRRIGVRFDRLTLVDKAREKPIFVEADSVLIDDDVCVAAACGVTATAVILVDQPWNRSFDESTYIGIHRVTGGWERITEKVREVVKHQ